MTCKAIATQLTARYDLLTSAVSKDDTRPALKHIYCDGKNIISTNGNILVFTENMESLKPGFYDLCTIGTGKAKTSKFVPVTDEKAKDWKFPDWKRIIPDCTNAKKIQFCGSEYNLELEIFKLQFAIASCGSGALLGQQNIDLLCKHKLTYTVSIIDGIAPLFVDLPSFFSILMMPKRASAGKSAVNEMLNTYKDNVIEAWEQTHKDKPAETADAGTVPETITEPKVMIEPAPEVKPEPVQQAEQQAENHATVEPVPKPALAPEPRKAPQKTAKAAKPKQRQRKPVFEYQCTLTNGKHITLDSIDAVRARKDVTHCHIAPRKAA